MADADPFRPVTGPLRTTDLIRQRAVEALLGQSALNHPGLVAEIRRRFGSTDVAAGALVREPVIEGAAPFVTDGRTFADCAGTLLHPNVIRAIASEQAGDYRFPPDAEPYKHQIEAWQHLTVDDRRSVLVSSGTGSGKTECFLMPLLHDLAREADAKGRLSGVRALALYPLNALIASQEERLRAWTAPFGGSIRFGLYNGLTPERLRAGDQPGPEQVADRTTLRSDPPPILVTNVTMLEYMTVRRIDRPLIENSRGMLRWIILDEAHGYVGSAAAEIALLIRRVLLTFGVSADDVRFVATSATIGEGRDVTDELRRFLRDLSGTDEKRVHVVIGKREPVSLPAPASGSPVLTLAEMGERDIIARNSAVQRFIRAAESRPVRWDEAQEMLAPTQASAEAVIEAVASSDDRHAPLLPLRVHSFLRAVPGLWSCLNSDCAGRPPEWPFGAIATERIDSCPHCQSPVFEVMSCRECGEPYLDCEERDGRLQARITPPDLDEFAVLREREVSVDEDEDEAPSDHQFEAVRRAIATRPIEGFRPLHVEPGSGRVHDSAQYRTTRLRSGDGDTCGACQATSGKAGAMLRPFRYGAPFLIGNAAPVMLDGVPRRLDSKAAYRPPADGRQLLSFTDSRQGTARFAANIQTNAERGFVRGFLYHAVQGSMSTADAGDPEISKLRDEIATLEDVGSPLVAELIAGKKRELEAKLTPSVEGVPWAVMRDRLAATPEVAHWMKQVWGNRDERYRADPAAFAEFLLLRELVRRPRRGNTAETIGLARLRFDAIDRAGERDIPEALRARNKTLADWQGLLASIVDMTVRANLAVRAAWADLHWITARGTLKLLLPPGEKAQATREVVWPMFGDKKTSPSNLSLILEKTLGLDRTERQDRALLNEVTEAAWNHLRPLFTSPGQPGYALDYSKARIAPVTDAWRCPVTRRILPELALGLTQYGHREGLSTANLPPQPIHFPALPVTFPRGEEIESVRAWLAADHEVASLREQGVWNNLHDRSALLSPYLRAAEHSAQQPPARLRRFEGEFKAGQINILNCSTTMEMGVDIGSVSAVMMTNVPPALANYRQRVGRAGRRRQGFASSLTYTRDTPLDRETFRDPQKYLARETRPPRVKLDSRRIVQRHVNALLLARWFAGAGGEAMKTQAGQFFGCPPEVGAARVGDAPVGNCLTWLCAPSTEEALRRELEQLTQGTVLAGDRTVIDAAANALREAQAGFLGEWEALQSQALNAPDAAAKAGIGYQLRRLAQENLLKELAVRSVLPGHGFPTDVVQFVTNDTPASDERGDDDDTSRRRRSFPSRNLDIAIRDYAPGAEVVVDGLVYRSAGVTLNWLRPADDREAREIQSLKVFWTCPTCGAADCGHAAPDHCPACHAEVPLPAQRRFLEPAGFTADMGEQPHADTDEVTYVEPEREEIVARGAAWQPCADPAQGRMRASHEGLVFYSSRGRNKQGYHVCLECGRAEPAGGENDRPLAGHRPLRGTKRNANGLCPGNEKPFKILPPIALGHETITDVAELQPTGIESEGAAWAAVSALREALGRQLGIESGELGMSVRRAVSPLGQPTWSLFLFDRNSGGAGFAPQALTLYEALLGDAEAILDCAQPGCTTGCSACVLTADLYRQQEIIDRQAALAWVRAARRALADVPDEDLARSGARYSRSVTDEIARAVDGGAREVTIWADGSLDVAALGGTRFSGLARRVEDRGAALTLVVDPLWLDGLDAAGKLALRDAANARPFALRRGTAPRFPNGAVGIAAVEDGATIWASRDKNAAVIGADWGQGMSAPVVRIAQEAVPLAPTIALETLLPASGTCFVEVRDELDGTIAGFGERLVALLRPAIRDLVGASPAVLKRIDYTDRYLQSPLAIRLLTEGLAGLRDAFARPEVRLVVSITTNRFKPNDRQPFAPDHDWQWDEDRRDVLNLLSQQRGLDLDLAEAGAGHGRVMTLHFADGAVVKLVLDQGFGPWRTPRYARFDFGQDAAEQARKLGSYSALVEARGPTYVVITSGGG
jgi:DEAD/DEAH box helicase domain-containing protein